MDDNDFDSTLHGFCATCRCNKIGTKPTCQAASMSTA